MNAIEVLAAARGNRVGPYVPAREEWLRDWSGPVAPIAQTPAVLVGIDFRPVDQRAGPWTCAANDPYGWEYGDTRSCRLDEIRLDLRRPECRDLLVRHGCPAWARDVPAAVWAWAGGAEVADVLGEWRKAADNDPDSGETWVRHRAHDPRNLSGGLWVAEVIQVWRTFAWECSVAVDPSAPWRWIRGPETGADGRACADIAALRAGCVLEESDGWYVPLVGGGAGWWPR